MRRSSLLSLSLLSRRSVSHRRLVLRREINTSTAAATINSSMKIKEEYYALGEKASAFLSASTDPYHAVHNAVTRLEAAGFVRLEQQEQGGAEHKKKKMMMHHVKPGGKYYYTQHHTTLVAFRVGNSYVAGQGGFHIIGAHTDSPNLRLKPRSKRASTKADLVQLEVTTYGGGLWHTWFDRDLSLSGKVILKQPPPPPRGNNGEYNDDEEEEEDGGTRFKHALVQLQQPVARISNLSIHLQSSDERAAFKVNREDHTSPMVASTVTALGLTAVSASGTLNDPTEKHALEQAITEQIAGSTAWQDGQEPMLLQRVAEQCQVATSDLVDWDLQFYDTQGATLGGLSREFLYSARLDNLASVFCATEALADVDLTDSQNVAMVVFFDHEEVGSVSSNGAGSTVLQQAVERISHALQQQQEDNSSSPSVSSSSWNPQTHAQTIDKSFCLSIDMAHAMHPNYASKHEGQHAPTLNRGIVIKNNANQRYATSPDTGFLLRELGRKVNVPMQEFVVRNDCPCGSTIGPTISAKTGIRTVDAGMPQFSMHSCREVMGVVDLMHGYKLFRGFFQHFADVDGSLPRY